MNGSRPGLGTLLRRLIDETDGAVEAAYLEAGLDFRPRYTPIVRTLSTIGPAPIRALAEAAVVSHSAASQTVSQMARAGLVVLKPGRDGRERIVALTAKAEAMLPTLERFWAQTSVAAAELDAQLSAPLSNLLEEAIAALAGEPFAARIRRAVEAEPARARELEI
jgi:DNA-binding MarR family transcriptional regulator